jgi:hypothetical protein
MKQYSEYGNTFPALIAIDAIFKRGLNFEPKEDIKPFCKADFVRDFEACKDKYLSEKR